ncbi:RNAse H-fold protein YqgF [Hoeflea sp. IMCC20628]|uniref:Holliday junction resolvase RuvX n=1 Tax=Hoeflea sp. IMCC20628 TaxID=1620421 RepID=UPI00063ACE53|nr:Holliday junction resolvase RuvX [Hoeflea sp. IMCC20628]AKI01001.1 RNAse H-fold protein YqgF [Hoeflea sp. IMCC20628]
MAAIGIEELNDRLLPGQTIAGIDLGTVTIGLAISDLSLRLASPRPMIKRKKFTLDAVVLLESLARDNAGAAIIGLPVNMDGSEGPRCQATRAFVRSMAEKTDLPFVFWDERLSTVAAERALIEMDVSRKKRKERIDSAAASFILQGALDRLAGLRRSKADSAGS